MARLGMERVITFAASGSHVERKKLGCPAGGVRVCKRALLGRTVKSAPPTSNETICTVGLPAYICALLKAKTRTPLNVEPAPKENRFADMYKPSGQMPNFG